MGQPQGWPISLLATLYSALNACIGSIDAALLAGTNTASAAMKSANKGKMINVKGSNWFT
jgi:hypothetical protein